MYIYCIYFTVVSVGTVKLEQTLRGDCFKVRLRSSNELVNFLISTSREYNLL